MGWRKSSQLGVEAASSGSAGQTPGAGAAPGDYGASEHDPTVARKSFCAGRDGPFRRRRRRPPTSAAGSDGRGGDKEVLKACQRADQRGADSAREAWCSASSQGSRTARPSPAKRRAAAFELGRRHARAACCVAASGSPGSGQVASAQSIKEPAPLNPALSKETPPTRRGDKGRRLDQDRG